LQKKFNFCKFAIYFRIVESRALELSNDVSFFIFGHQTWDLEGGQIDPPPYSGVLEGTFNKETQQLKIVKF